MEKRIASISIGVMAVIVTLLTVLACGLPVY